MMPQSALHTVTEKAGALFAEYAGWTLPTHYGDLAREYIAATTAAAVFDYSHAAKLQLTGPDAPLFISNLSTNEIKALPLGGGCETYFCDPRAKALFQAWVYHVRLHDGRNALWLETSPSRNEALFKHLDRYLISEQVEMEDMTTRFAQMHVAGPTAKAVLEAALADTLPDLVEFQHLERTFGSNATCSIRRRDPLGVPGYDVVCWNEPAEGVWRMLTAAGATPAGLKTYEQLRIEAGTPVYGIDFDETRFVMEVGKVERAVSYSKGCYLGQEPIVMTRDRAGHAPRAFVALKLLGEPPPTGSKIILGAEEVGVTTSATRSPRLGASVALGYVRWKHREVGTVFIVNDYPAEVITVPIPIK
jgi:folate-binding protein YgfZ